MIEYNRFVDRNRRGRTLTHGGYTSHAQAGARMAGGLVIFLLLQGKPDDVRGLVAHFHAGDLPGYVPFPGEEVYVRPHPTVELPDGEGIEVAIVHRALVPGALPASATHGFTFGPPHFGRMLQAAMGFSVTPEQEQALWDLAQQARHQAVVHEFTDTWNVRLWLVRLDAARWGRLDRDRA